MKTIGLLGGMSWESTAVYYQLMNEGMRKQLGGLHSAKIVMYSFDFEEVVACQTAGNWAKATELLVQAARRLETAGADLLLIGTNTMHKIADEIQQNLTIPLVHVADVTADAVLAQGLRKVGLLGTRYTMEQAFYRDRLAKRGIDVIIPDESGKDSVHQIIFDELCQGVIRAESKTRYLEVIQKLVEQGAQGIILGCTEIPLLVKQTDVSVPIFDTTALHVERALDYALDQDISSRAD